MQLTVLRLPAPNRSGCFCSSAVEAESCGPFFIDILNYRNNLLKSACALIRKGFLLNEVRKHSQAKSIYSFRGFFVERMGLGQPIFLCILFPKSETSIFSPILTMSCLNPSLLMLGPSARQRNNRTKEKRKMKKKKMLHVLMVAKLRIRQ